MTTFTLKKYEETKPEENTEQTQEQKEENKKEQLSLTVNVVGSISEIVAKALNKALSKKVNVIEQTDGPDTNVKAISTEDINSNPADTFNSINKDDVVFIHAGGPFKTKEEEWFLSNIANKTDNVFLSLEKFINHIKLKLEIQD